MKKRFRVILLMLVCVVLFGFVSCGSGEEITEPDLTTRYPEVTILVKDYGTIKIKLYPNKAPETVNNFIYLINKGFYNGLSFHRIISGFMIQGGDPNGDGSGGPGYCIKGEFYENGFTQNDLWHKMGVVSMARTDKQNDSAGSQFFIVHKDSQSNHQSLDGKYAGFGKVIEGMEVIDEIAKIRVKGDNGALADPSKAPKISKITVDTFGKEYPEPTMLPQN